MANSAAAGRAVRSIAFRPNQCTSPSRRTIAGPPIWPSAKAAVIRPSNRAGWRGAKALACCKPIIVAIMKLLPTSKAARPMAKPDALSEGSAAPTAIANCATAQSLS